MLREQSLALKPPTKTAKNTIATITLPPKLGEFESLILLNITGFSNPGDDVCHQVSVDPRNDAVSTYVTWRNKGTFEVPALPIL